MNEDLPHTALPESRFIEPDERCPEPGRWTSTDGDSTEREVSELIFGLVRGLQPRLTVETGSAFGQTTRQISQALAHQPGKLITFEIDDERRRDLERRARTEAWAGNVEFRAASLEADLAGLPPIDLAFFDTYYELRVPEFHHFHRWMRKGTVVAFHDTAPGRGAHRIQGGRSLREEIEAKLVAPGILAALDLPTPRGLTLGEVL